MVSFLHKITVPTNKIDNKQASKNKTNRILTISISINQRPIDNNSIPNSRSRSYL
ncbi:hypothetical protein Hanom_Chr00s000005g01611651 [Helianthus anomalus]